MTTILQAWLLLHAVAWCLNEWSSSSSIAPTTLELCHGATITSNEGASSSSTNYYLSALRSSILYFEGQRSGRLPPSQRVGWRSHSALADGFDQGVQIIPSC